ncbi:MAG: 50S ribosomal protein L10 [Bacteroidales bacterium]|jgi:large subunit ribosomal protein L10|nr:50S ribosomal protein L10 [Bacteroidales bacterium]MDI9592935.1 50S ribosomal protein L10 [Bacteroidota bacterium]NLH34111.1 50S ribosomal protein L10 [Lentimicrobium sp.]OQC38006.1 MAG: 50S ribosomal protein L10 [Bacteroidetes bacterium ADurb.Bin041]MBP7874761.1 50S ribosomal protein L10 [Bacteroidales bacterium]
MTSAEKDQIIEALSKQLNESSNFYVTNIANLTVAVTNELRRTCFKNDIKLKVVKNTLLKKAMERTGKDFTELFPILKGETSVMFTESANLPAKVIKDFRKRFKTDKPILKGAYVQESFFVGEDKLDTLENIKSKNEVIADVIALLQSPAKNVISALQSGGHKLSGILKTLSEKGE